MIPNEVSNAKKLPRFLCWPIRRREIWQGTNFRENSTIRNPDSIHNPKSNCNPKNSDGGNLSSGEQEAVSSMVVQAEVDSEVTEKSFVFSLDHRQISLAFLA